jgi:hypothetical protein
MLHVEAIPCCEDCFCVLGLGDATSLDYWYSPERAAERLAEIERAADTLIASEGGYLSARDGESDTIESCGICGREPCPGEETMRALAHYRES